MADDWVDWLEGLSAGARGINEGLTLSMKPYNAFEDVRTKSLANEKSDIQLRDLMGMQFEREATPDYYPNAVGSVDAANRLASTKAGSDIYGLNTALDFRKSMDDPNGYFQMLMRAKGLTPDMPEYQLEYIRMLSQADPAAAIKMFDTSKIPAMQQKELNMQAVLMGAEQYAQRMDKGAHAIQNADGTIDILGSDGQRMTVPAEFYFKLADMASRPGGPQAAISQGIGDEIKIAQSNRQVYDTLVNKVATDKQYSQLMVGARVGYEKQLTDIAKEISDFDKNPQNMMLPPEERDARKNELMARRTAIAQKHQEIVNILQAAAQTGRRGPSVGGPPVTGPTANVPVQTSGLYVQQFKQGSGASRAMGGLQALQALPQPGGPSQSMFGVDPRIQQALNSLFGGP